MEGSQNIKVAIFEDDPGKLRLIKVLLSKIGYEIDMYIATTIEEGEELLRNIKGEGENPIYVDVVLMDGTIGRDRHNGHGWASELQALKNGGEIVLISISEDEKLTQAQADLYHEHSQGGRSIREVLSRLISELNTRRETRSEFKPV